MNASRRNVWIRRSVRVSAVLGLCLLSVALVSLFVNTIYQQPPGAWMPLPGSVPAGGSYTEPPGTPPAGDIRVRLVAGSLIVANGHLPPTKSHVGMSTLGYMYQAGLSWSWLSPARAWQIVR